MGDYSRAAALRPAGFHDAGGKVDSRAVAPRPAGNLSPVVFSIEGRGGSWAHSTFEMYAVNVREEPMLVLQILEAV